MTSSDIDYIKQIDFTRGFSSWHVKWLLTNREDTTTRCQYSTTFETVLARDGDGSESKFEWFLAVRLERDADEAMFGLCWANLNEPINVIFRLALLRSSSSNTDDEPLFNDTLTVVAAPSTFIHGHGVHLPLDEVESYLKKGEVEFHCWIELPVGVPVRNRLRRLADESPATFSRLNATAELALDFGRLLIGGTDGWARSLSDVSLIATDDDGALRSFACHRIVLAARSPFLRRILAVRTTTTIEFLRIRPKMLARFLEYIYAGSTFQGGNANDDDHESDGFAKLPFDDIRDAFSLLRAAVKCELPGLIGFCESALISMKYQDENYRIRQLLEADRLGLDRLKAVCVAALCTNATAHFGDGFKIPNREGRDRMALRVVDTKTVFPRPKAIRASMNLECTEEDGSATQVMIDSKIAIERILMILS